MADERLAEARKVLSGVQLTDQNAQFLQSNSQSLAEAFKQLGLDPNNSAHRAMLPVVLADFQFGRRKKGRPAGKKHWHAARLLVLALDYEEVIAGNPNMSYSKAAAAIEKRAGYKCYTAVTIRQRLPAAKRQLALARAFIEPEKPVTATPAHIAPSGGLLGSLPKL